MKKTDENATEKSRLQTVVVEQANFIHSLELNMMSLKGKQKELALMHYVNDLTRLDQIETMAQVYKREKSTTIDHARGIAEQNWLRDDSMQQHRDIWNKSKTELEKSQADIEMVKCQIEYQLMLLKISMIAFEYCLAEAKRPLKIQIG